MQGHHLFHQSSVHLATLYSECRPVLASTDSDDWKELFVRSWAAHQVVLDPAVLSKPLEAVCSGVECWLSTVTV